MRKVYIEANVKEIDNFLKERFKDNLTTVMQNADVVVFSRNTRRNENELKDLLAKEIKGKEVILMLDDGRSLISKYAKEIGVKHIFYNPITITDVVDKIRELIARESEMDDKNEQIEQDTAEEVAEYAGMEQQANEESGYEPQVTEEAEEETALERAENEEKEENEDDEEYRQLEAEIETALEIMKKIAEKGRQVVKLQNRIAELEAENEELKNEMAKYKKKMENYKRIVENFRQLLSFSEDE